MAKTQETMRHVFEVHVPYEIGRLVAMYRLLLDRNQYRPAALQGPAASETGRTAETLEDALIVGFCTHARNLLEFFYREAGDHYAAAVDYADTTYQPLNEKIANVDRLKNKLNNQINHLTYMRTDETSEKIGPNERKEIIKLIGSEAVRLQPQLKPGYDAKCLLIDDLLAAAASVGLSPVRATATWHATLDGASLT